MLEPDQVVTITGARYETGFRREPFSLGATGRCQRGDHKNGLQGMATGLRSTILVYLGP